MVEKQPWILYQKQPRFFKGSILLPAICFLLLVNSLLFLALEQLYVTSLFVTGTKDFYHVKIIKELFLSEYLEKDLPEKGQRFFDCGTVIYEENQEELKIIITLQEEDYYFVISKEILQARKAVNKKENPPKKSDTDKVSKTNTEAEESP